MPGNQVRDWSLYHKIKKAQKGKRNKLSEGAIARIVNAKVAEEKRKRGG